MSPRASTTATPSSESAAPTMACRVGRSLKNSAPIASIHTGELEAISVTFSGVDVVSARYCSAL